MTIFNIDNEYSNGESKRQSAQGFGNYKELIQMKRGRKLGEGGQGKVSLCIDSNGNQVVVKDLSFKEREAAERCFSESANNGKMDYRYLIRYLAGEWGSETKVDPKTGMPGAPGFYVSILMPYYPEGDLDRFMSDYDISHIPWAKLSSIALQVATSLLYLHTLSPPIVHGDIKPENILMFNNKTQVVLMDLETAREFVIRPRNGDKDKPLGTMEWMAPETANGGEVCPRSDIWSLGLVMFVMATLPEFMLFAPAPGEGNILLNSPQWTQEKLTNLIQTSLDSKGCHPALRDVIIRCLQINPNDRPTTEELANLFEDVAVHIIAFGE